VRSGRIRRLTLPLLLLALLGAALGVGLSVLAGGRFESPSTVSTHRWRTISPALDETIKNPLLGRGSHVIGGALVIREHAFHASDVLVPLLAEAPARIELTVAEHTGPVTLVLSTGDDQPRTLLFLTRTQYTNHQKGAEWTDGGVDGEWVVTSNETGTHLALPSGAVQISRHAIVGMELTAAGEEARIDGLMVRNAQGEAFFTESFDPVGSALEIRVVGAAVGAVWALAFGVAILAGKRGVVLTVLLAAAPLLILPISEGWWLQSVERLYLTRTPYWHLARAALGLSLVPLIIVALTRSGALVPKPRPSRPPRFAMLAWGLTALVTTALACRDLTGVALVVGVLGGGLVIAPALVARHLKLDLTQALVADLPGLISVVLLGWPGGLFVLLTWRLLVVASAARLLLDRAPKLGANALLGLFLAIPLATELAVRSTYLGEAWQMSRLTGEAASKSDWREAKAFWTGACGPKNATRVVSVAWAGGSSTGGAYQFHNEPTGFFPAQAHEQLCETLPPDTRLVSRNYGDGGRDTYTIARSIDTMLASSDADLLVLYVGVNDVLTSGSTLTRKARAERVEGWTRGATGVLALASRSRLLTGLSLLVRQPREKGDDMVPEVPLGDADENLRMVAAATATRGTAVLLLTEQLRSTVSGDLGSYSAMQRAVAADHPHLTWFDLRGALEPYSDEPLMADRNHLNREGGVRFGQVLAPKVAALTQLSATPPPAAEPAAAEPAPSP
jgi:hypothetical protein